MHHAGVFSRCSNRHLLLWEKASNVVKLLRESRAAKRARMNAGCEPNDSFANATMGMKPFLSNKEHLTLDVNFENC